MKNDSGHGNINIPMGNIDISLTSHVFQGYKHLEHACTRALCTKIYSVMFNNPLGSALRIIQYQFLFFIYTVYCKALLGMFFM